MLYIDEDEMKLLTDEIFDMLTRKGFSVPFGFGTGEIYWTLNKEEREKCKERLETFESRMWELTNYVKFQAGDYIFSVMKEEE